MNEEGNIGAVIRVMISYSNRSFNQTLSEKKKKKNSILPVETVYSARRLVFSVRPSFAFPLLPPPHQSRLYFTDSH